MLRVCCVPFSMNENICYWCLAGRAPPIPRWYIENIMLVSSRPRSTHNGQVKDPSVLAQLWKDLCNEYPPNMKYQDDRHDLIKSIVIVLFSRLAGTHPAWTGRRCYHCDFQEHGGQRIQHPPTRHGLWQAVRRSVPWREFRIFLF